MYNNFVKPRELSRNCGCRVIKARIHRPIKTLSLIMFLLICCQNYPNDTALCIQGPSTIPIRQPHVSTYDPCFQPCYQRHLRHQPWITVTNYGSDTKQVKTQGPGMQARRRLPSEARFHNYFTVFSNTDNSTCMLSVESWHATVLGGRVLLCCETALSKVTLRTMDMRLRHRNW